LNTFTGQKVKLPLMIRSNGFPPFKFSTADKSGKWHSCLALSSDGILSGLTTKACEGKYSFTVATTDSTGAQAGQESYVLIISDGSTGVVVTLPPAVAQALATTPALTPAPVPAQTAVAAPASNPAPAPIPTQAEATVADPVTPPVHQNDKVKPTATQPVNGKSPQGNVANGGGTANGNAPAPSPATAAGGAPSSVPSPTAPTLSGTPMASDKSVAGKAQVQDKNYSSVTVYVCLSAQKPTDPTAKLDCSKDKSAQQDIQLTGGGAPVQSIAANADGSFSAQLVTPLLVGSYLYVTEVATPAGDAKTPLTSSSTPVLIKATFSRTAPLGVAAAGLDVTGAASANPSAVFLGLGLIDMPLMNNSMNPSDSNFKNDISYAPWWLTADIRVSGMAQPGALSSSQASTAGMASYLATAVTATPDSIVKSIDSSVSVAYNPHPWNFHIPTGTFDVGDYTSAHLKAPETLLTLSLLANIGAITPMSAKQANPAVYYLTSQIWSYLQNNPTLPVSQPVPSSCNPTAGATPTCYVAFIPQDRTRFYRNYNAGLRLKFYPGDYNANQYRFPGMADVTIGQNEYVTGGMLRRLVLHAGGVMPVPMLDGWYIFGSTDAAFAKAGQVNQQLLLSPAPSSANLTLTSAGVYGVTVAQPNRDRYSIGFAVDIAHLYTAYKTSQAKKTAAAATSTSQ
jgi:hypothetical protein